MSLRAEIDSLIEKAAAPWTEPKAKAFLARYSSGLHPLVLCGAGGLGLRTLEGLRQLKIQPAAFADNNPHRQGTLLEGIPIMSPAAAVDRFGQEALYLFCIWGAHAEQTTQSMLAAWEKQLGVTIHPIWFLYWCHPEYFLPHYTQDIPQKIPAARESIHTAAALFEEPRSRQEFLRQLQWRSGDQDIELHKLGGVKPYLDPSLIRLKPDEVIADMGAFDGDTLKDFLSELPGSSFRYYAFEPDPTNHGKLELFVSSLNGSLKKEIHAVKAGIGETKDTLRFAAQGQLSSKISQAGSVLVDIHCIDDYFANLKVSFIKMDIEGAELGALRGGLSVIKRDRPLLCISVYHQQSDLWEIPVLLASVLPDYRYYLRPHDNNGWDLILYAIPDERL